MPIYTCTTHHTIRNIRNRVYHTVRLLDFGEYAAVLNYLWSKRYAQAESRQPKLPKTVDRERNTTSNRHQQTGFTTKKRHNPSRTEWCDRCDILYSYLQPGEPPSAKSYKIIKFCLTHDLQSLLHRHFILVQKRCMNRKQILVQTDINPQRIPKDTGPCNGPCVICPFMKTATEFTSRITKTRFPINGRYNCKTKSTVYLINCKQVAQRATIAHLIPMCQGQISFQKTYKWAMETRGPKSNSSELLCLSWLPATLMTIWSKMNELACTHHFPILSLWEIVKTLKGS